VLVHFVLHARDRFDATRDERLGFACDDALRGQCDRLQARRAETIDRRTRDADRATGTDRDLARDVVSGGAFGNADPIGRRRLRPAPGRALDRVPTAWAPMVAPCVMLSAPRQDFASPVRA
jgi:hypothetical protein